MRTKSVAASELEGVPAYRALNTAELIARIVTRGRGTMIMLKPYCRREARVDHRPITPDNPGAWPATGGHDHYERTTELSGVSRQDRPHPRRIGAALEFAGAPAAGVAQYRDRLHGRYGLGRYRLLRLGDRHAQHRCAGRPRHPVHPLYDASDLFAGARRVVDRQQRAFGGDRVAGQQQSGLPRLFRRHSARRADHRRDLAGGRLRDGCGRQVAQFDQWRRAQPDLANLSRLRPFLRVSRRRDRVLLSGAHRLQQHRRADRRVS